jgi:mono/diheme cytochrome c family protein
MTQTRTMVFVAITASAIGMAGCQPSSQSPAQNSASMPMTVTRWYDAQRVARGDEVFRQNCAACHGTNAEGAPNWQKPGPDGKYPAPPLNGTAHAWHHPFASLKDTIRNGTARLGGSMPPWRDKLSEQDIESVIAWFQSHWPDELYAAWARMDAESRRAGR